MVSFTKTLECFYPLVVFRSVTLPLHHVQEATVVDPHFKDLSNLPPLVPICPEDGWQLIVPRDQGKGRVLRA
jgi:hypothetical protein